MRTRKASLNALSAFLDQGARMAVGLLLTPVLVSVLGGNAFGIWQVLLRSTANLSSLDGRGVEVLKWRIAGMQESADDAAKQRAVGAALIVWFLFLPLMVTTALVLIWRVPDMLGYGGAMLREVRYASLLLLINLAILGAINIFDAVLRGINLGYKRMGVMATIVLFSGALSILVALMGGGLIGLAGVQVFATLITGFTLYALVKRHARWLGMARPTRAELRAAFDASAWFVAWALIGNGIFLGDVLILGYASGSQTVSDYVVTAYVVQMIMVVIATAVSATLPGLGGIVGAQQYDKALGIWRESWLYSWLLGTTIGSTVLLCNPSFVSLWVGRDHYAGDLSSLLIVVAVFQLLFIRHDAAVINLAINIRRKVLIGGVALIASVVLAVPFAQSYGIIGLCVGLVLGRAILTASYPRIVLRFLRAPHSKGPPLPLKAWLITALIFGASWQIGSHVEIESWWELGIGGLAGVSVSGALAYLLGLSGVERSTLRKRITATRGIAPSSV